MEKQLNLVGATGINFKEEEVKKYPLLTQLQKGLSVFALNNNDYGKLRGEIVELHYGEDRETENECVLEIVVDFEEPSALARKTVYANLNGTSVEMVIMAEDEIAVCFNGVDYQLLTGQLACENCCKPIERVEETQNEYIEWVWNPETQEYVKENSGGDTEGRRCSECAYRIEGEEVLSY